MITSTSIPSPLGRLHIAASRHGLIACSFENKPNLKKLEGDQSKKGNAILLQTQRELDEYFAGKRQEFDIQVVPEGTEFQKNVWKALQDIPFGDTASYSDIAHRIGNPKAVRAVGMANNRNPVSLIIPCHRVIGKDGSLVGYGGGLDRKKQLLHLEGIFN